MDPLEIERKIADDKWPLFKKRAVEQITDQLPQQLLMTIVDITLNNFYEDHPHELIPDYLDYCGEDNVLKELKDCEDPRF